VAQLIGLDVGTAACKAVVFGEDGVMAASASREYPVELPHPGWAEQDIELVWSRALDSMAEAIAAASASEVAAIGLSVHGEAITPVDVAGRPLRPTILGMDTRTDSQNAWLRDRFGARHLFERTGMPIHTINTLPKLLWIREQEPDVWAAADQFLLVEDFFIRHMTGRAVTSQCLASRTQLFNLEAGAWDGEILDALGLDAGRLAEVQPSGTLVGLLTTELTERLGLSSQPGVVTGGHDQACGALGVGLISPGLASVSSGTAEVVEVALASPIVIQSLYEGNISVYHHVVPELYLAMTLNHSGGLALRWFRDGFCEPQVAQAAESGEDAYDLILAEASPDPTGLLVLPHFSGAGTPTIDTASKGAILEGLTFELLLNLDLLRAGGVKIDVLRAIGGGAKSKLWLQLKADVTGIPVVTPEVTEAAALGAALLAGLGAGLFASPADAAGRFLRLTHTYIPDPARHEAYSRQFELYQQVYPAVSPISHQL